MTEMTLDKMRVGEVGIITSVDERCDAFSQRVMDMGLTEGTEITVVATAPFHGPIEILVRGSNLVLGRNIARRITIKLQP